MCKFFSPTNDFSGIFLMLFDFVDLQKMYIVKNGSFDGLKQQKEANFHYEFLYLT